MLSQLAINVLKAQKPLRERIASLFGKSIWTIDLYISQNLRFGPLTAWELVKFISKETQLNENQIIVEEELVNITTEKVAS